MADQGQQLLAVPNDGHAGPVAPPIAGGVVLLPQDGGAAPAAVPAPAATIAAPAAAIAAPAPPQPPPLPLQLLPQPLYLPLPRPQRMMQPLCQLVGVVFRTRMLISGKRHPFSSTHFTFCRRNASNSEFASKERNLTVPITHLWRKLRCQCRQLRKRWKC